MRRGQACRWLSPDHEFHRFGSGPYGWTELGEVCLVPSSAGACRNCWLGIVCPFGLFLVRRDSIWGEMLLVGLG